MEYNLTNIGKMPQHQNKHITEALESALQKGWRLIKRDGASNHTWGILCCPQENEQLRIKCNDQHYCKFHIFSTGNNPENTAKKINKRLHKCVYQ